MYRGHPKASRVRPKLSLRVVESELTFLTHPALRGQVKSSLHVREFRTFVLPLSARHSIGS
jgi:hypothetical protein